MNEQVVNKAAKKKEQGDSKKLKSHIGMDSGSILGRSHVIRFTLDIVNWRRDNISAINYWLEVLVFLSNVQFVVDILDVYPDFLFVSDAILGVYKTSCLEENEYHLVLCKSGCWRIEGWQNCFYLVEFVSNHYNSTIVDKLHIGGEMMMPTNQSKLMSAS